MGGGKLRTSSKIVTLTPLGVFTDNKSIPVVDRVGPADIVLKLLTGIN